MTPPPGPRVLIDACVLYPNVLREIVLAVAATGAFAPLVSPRIVAEWVHAAARLGPAQAALAQGEAAVLRARWPGAEVTPAPAIEAALDLPDAADTHVLAAAITGRASVILTENLRDFPRRALAHHGVQAQNPDDFLMMLWLADAAGVAGAVAGVQADTARLSGRAQPVRALLRRVRMPRLGKALDGA